MARRRRARGWFSAWNPWAEPRRREPAPRQAALAKQLGREPAPVRAEGRTLAHTFWGRAWCENLERYHDFANRLPRGRTYLRQGAVLDLAIERGRITALVMGTTLYRVGITIAAVEVERWSALRHRCDGKLSSLIALLEGRIGDDVMAAVTDRAHGLFPEPREIELSCSCPDWATMCKHVAAVLYGVGVRLDERPQLLFELRGVDPQQMIAAPRPSGPADESARLAGDLAEIFGIAIAEGPASPASEAAARPAARAGAGAVEGRRAVAKRTADRSTQAKQTKRTKVKALVMTRQQLLARGLPPSTLQGWLRRRVLVPTAEPGIYELTDEARTCLEWHG